MQVSVLLDDRTFQGSTIFLDSDCSESRFFASSGIKTPSKVHGYCFPFWQTKKTKFPQNKTTSLRTKSSISLHTSVLACPSKMSTSSCKVISAPQSIPSVRFHLNCKKENSVFYSKIKKTWLMKWEFNSLEFFLGNTLKHPQVAQSFRSSPA